MSFPLMSVLEASSGEVPILLHLPHSGTYIPGEIRERLRPEKAVKLDETDWFLDRLYDFAGELGISTIMASHHRWVADLNRDPGGLSLYEDGRVITGVVPTRDFNGEDLYLPGAAPDPKETAHRIAKYHSDYFSKLRSIISEKLNKFHRLLIWDGHSIRRSVPGISDVPFPDLILGTDNERTAPSHVIDTISDHMLSSGLVCTFNQPFKGGYITRSLCDHSSNVFTVQMEMSKDLYMVKDETEYDPKVAERVKELFKSTLKSLTGII